jgi:L,D-peptidoglycan transpeptidase YkuD (ErfK/YbiS/YcfS/YnhG family)
MRQVEGYREGVVVGYNGSMMPVPGYGSCIFLHIWDESKEGTSGCTAMQSDNLGELVRWLDSSKYPVLIQLPEAEYKRIKNEWHWPLP